MSSSPLRLLDGPNRRALWRAFRADLGSTAPPESPDPELTAVLERPFESLPDTAARFGRLNERLRERTDRRSVFLSIYTEMTTAVHDGIENGRFDDPEWMRAYARTFANYYRRAFLAFEKGNLDDVPEPWQVAFGTALAGDGLVLQDAFLGVNAHINYDLALALDEIGIDPNREARYRDHRVINEILADLVDAQQSMLARIYAPGIDDVDALFGRFDERLTLLSMTEGRDQAWRVASVLADFDWPLVRPFARWLLRTTAVGVAAVVRAPALDPTAMDTLRRIEREDVGVESLLNRVADHGRTSV